MRVSAGRRLTVRAVAVLAALLVAAGVAPSAGAGAQEPTAEPTPWSRQVLGPTPQGDSSLVTASSGRDVVLVQTSGDGTLRGYRSTDGGLFRAGSPLDIGTSFFSLGGVTRWRGAWWAIGRGGLRKVNGDTQLLFAVKVFRSVDGLTWAPVATTVERSPADVSGLVATSKGLLAVGTLRLGRDPSFGGFRPVAWRTADGKTWRRSGLPFTGSESGIGSVVLTRSRLLGFGNDDGRSVMWASTDGGHLWRLTEPDGLGEGIKLDEAAVLGDGTVLAQSRAIGDATETVFARSSDGGRTWIQVASPPPRGGLHFGGGLSAGGNRAFTLMAADATGGDPGVCYVDIDRCRQGGEVAVYVTEDAGTTWQRTDLAGLELDPWARPQAVIAHRDRVWIYAHDEEGFALFGRAASSPWPTEAEPEIPTFEGPFLAEGESPQQGVRYATPLYIHCGMDWLYFGGTPWRRIDSGVDVETGAGQRPLPQWPSAGQTIYGFATLVAPNRVEYSIGDGEVIATYGRTDQRPPGCA